MVGICLCCWLSVWSFAALQKSSSSLEICARPMDIFPDSNGHSRDIRISIGDNNFTKECEIRGFRIFTYSATWSSAIHRVSRAEINKLENRRGQFGRHVYNFDSFSRDLKEDPGDACWKKTDRFPSSALPVP